MKLRCSLPPRQRLFAISFAFCALCSLSVSALAQDKIVSKGQTTDVKILGVSGANVQVQVGAGTIGVPLSTITSVIMAAPADVAEANKAFQARDYAKALTLAKGISSKFTGLPVDWARETSSLVGDIYVAMGKLPEAEAAYKEFQRAYPKGGSIQVDIGTARIAFSRKNFDEAAAKLEPIADAAQKNPFETGATAVAYSQAFFLLGQIAEARQQNSPALEYYLKTVTLFYHDANAARQAQERADFLRKQDPSLTIP
jgi:tetratricopeptide (TPR) repeat protein